MNCCNECRCPPLDRPVCGTNGYTYPSTCKLLCAKTEYPDLEIASQGPCANPPPQLNPNSHRICRCSKHYRPVCGNDGNTYENLCAFGCAQSKTDAELEIYFKGECPLDKRSSKEVPEQPDRDVGALCMCTTEYVPLCASNDRTYPNRCEFECAQRSDPNLKLKSEGKCEDDKKRCRCNFGFEPVCASNGQTYPSNCTLKCAGRDDIRLTFVKNGEC